MLGQKLSSVALFKTFHCLLCPASHSAATYNCFLTAFAFPLPLTIDNVKVSNVKRYEDGWEFKAMQQLFSFFNPGHLKSFAKRRKPPSDSGSGSVSKGYVLISCQNVIWKNSTDWEVDPQNKFASSVDAIAISEI